MDDLVIIVILKIFESTYFNKDLVPTNIFLFVNFIFVIRIFMDVWLLGYGCLDQHIGIPKNCMKYKNVYFHTQYFIFKSFKRIFSVHVNLFLRYYSFIINALRPYNRLQCLLLTHGSKYIWILMNVWALRAVTLNKKNLKG